MLALEYLLGATVDVLWVQDGEAILVYPPKAPDEPLLLAVEGDVLLLIIDEETCAVYARV